ncbi:TPA: hypothetical protein HA351_01955 [Methanosarcinaceae archaeon]|nr:hypothetical protein [Methanosarcinaceae archaeon]
MNKKMSRALIPIFLMLILLSGALGLEAGFFELQTANAVEVIQNGSPEADRSPGVSPEETFEQTVEESSLVGFFSKEGFSKETLSPARKKNLHRPAAAER